MHIRDNVPLKGLNTFGIDVTARYFACVETVEDLRDLFSRDILLDYPHLILGGGSNILFTDNYPGLVIRICFRGIEVIADDQAAGFIYVKAHAGEQWDDFVGYCVDNGWGGLENLSLIPGQVGTSPIQNIGAYGVELKDSFLSLDAMEKKTGLIRSFSAEACQFGYRDSFFKQAGRGRYVITSVTFKLSTSAHHLVKRYGSLQQELDSRKIRQPGIADIREAVIHIRQSKLPDPAAIGNAGSFFKNPVVSHTHYQALKNTYPGIVAFPDPGGMKLAAGWLIEQAGWKGHRRGDAGVHEKQALVLVNYGMATGQEILELAESVKLSVLKLFEVALETEVNIV